MALFGVAALGYAGLALLAAWMIWTRQAALEKLRLLLVMGAGSFVLGIGLVVLGVKLAMKVPRNYDPTDPHEPRMKF